MNRAVVGFCFFLDTFTFLIKIWDRARSTQRLTQTQIRPQTQAPTQIQIRCRCRLWAATGFCLRQRTWIWIWIRIRMGMGIRIVWHDSPWTARGCPNLKLVHTMLTCILTFHWQPSSICATKMHLLLPSIGVKVWEWSIDAQFILKSMHFAGFCFAPSFFSCFTCLLVFNDIKFIPWRSPLTEFCFDFATTSRRIFRKMQAHIHTHVDCPFHTHSQKKKNFDFVLHFSALSRTGFFVSANCSKLTVKLKLQPKSPFP